jgi:membrane-anchored protein YejM (alkaline phosphatase superfamily)
MINKVAKAFIPTRGMRISDETLHRLKVTKELVKMFDNDVRSMDDLINKALDSLEAKTLKRETIECMTNTIL